MTRTFGERMSRLRIVRAALHLEAERAVRAGGRDRAALRRLHDLAQRFKLDAHSLLVSVLFEDVPPALVDAVDELLDLFREMVERLDAQLASGPGDA